MQNLVRLGDPTLGRKMIALIKEQSRQIRDHRGRRPVFMEVCGTHTVAIARLGLRSLLGDTIELRSGPGCPVCVTAAADLDLAIAMATLPQVIVATFGDMVRVPGSASSLEKERAQGAQVKVVASTLEAIELAAANPRREIIFLGVGFETTAPLAALSIREARQRHLHNFSLLSLYKLMPPALHTLLNGPDLVLDGLLLPGHVSAVTGRQAFDFVAGTYGLPAVIAGFELLDILGALLALLEMLSAAKVKVLNCYTRAVKETGNPQAREVVADCFATDPATWRGLGLLAASGLHLRHSYLEYDAAVKFAPPVPVASPRGNCRCSEILQGRLLPNQCPLYAGACTPAHPAGPCMVSAEGACTASYHYRSR